MTWRNAETTSTGIVAQGITVLGLGGKMMCEIIVQEKGCRKV